jgi:hypothetical protein
MARNSGGRNIVSAVRETLDSVVSPSVRDTILARALAEGHRKELPTEPEELDEFVQGPLHDSLVRSLGPELGMSVASELERIVTLASKDAAARSSRRPESQRPPRRPSQSLSLKDLPPTNPNPKRRVSRSTMPSREATPPATLRPAPSMRAPHDEDWLAQQRRGVAPTMPAARRAPAAETSTVPPHGSPSSDDYPAGTAKALGVLGSIEPRPSGRPIVLVASTNVELLRSFQGWLDQRSSVEVVSSAVGLLKRLSETNASRAVVVLDGRHPSLRPLTLAALAEELPGHTKILLWGVPPHVHARMCSVASAAEKWLVAAGDTTSEEIVARCARLVG